MDQAVSIDSNKRGNLEDLSKDDLIKKCIHLLTIAQKAKQAKSILQEENAKLKDDFERNLSASQEMIENLTQQKLSLTSNVDELKTQNKFYIEKIKVSEDDLRECQELLNSSDNENISYQRQISRLTEENEQLLNDLDALEKQIEKFKDIGVQQQTQLLELEKNKTQDDRRNMDELQGMLSVSLEEVKRLKVDNNMLLDKLDNLQTQLAEKDINLEIISEKLVSKNNLMKEMQEEIDNLKVTNECEDNIKRLEENNMKMKEKVKLYHSKIVKFASIAKQLQEDKDTILDLFRVYNDQVNDWKDKLQVGERCLVGFISNMESENLLLKQQVMNSDSDLGKKLSELNLNHENEIKIIRDQYENEKSHILKKLNSKEEIIENMMKENQLLKQNMNDSKQDENIFDDKMKEVNASNEDLKKMNDKLKNETLLLQDKVQCMEKLNSDLSTNINKLAETIEEHNILIDSLRSENQAVKENWEELKLSCKQLETENIFLNTQLKESIPRKECEEIQIKLRKTELDLQQNQEFLERLKINYQNFKTEKDKTLKELENEIRILQNENTNVRKSKDELLMELDLVNSEKKNFKITLKEKTDEFYKILDENQNKLVEYEKLIKELQMQNKSSEKLGSLSSEEIHNLAEENKSLNKANEMLLEKLDEYEQSHTNLNHSYCQTDEISTDVKNVEEQLAHLKQENTELLSEMNEMNQAIKERGGNISKLEAHCEEVMKKLQIYETQANKNIDNITEKENTIEKLRKELEQLKSEENVTGNNDNNIETQEIISLKKEIEMLKERINSNFDTSYADNDAMSTSTISRTDESNRLKDLEGSWEERYGKLRNLAIKLKGKIRELTQAVNKQETEKEELQKKLALSHKTIQNLQNQSDKLEDELECTRKENKQYLSRLNVVANDISKDKLSLADKDEIINDLRQEIENFKKEKQATDIWKKQVSVKVQTLRKELEANNLLKKDFESKILNLSNDLDAKEQALKSEIESHKHTKSLLEQSNNECKKHSVLNLEMQDYERSNKETSKKLDKQLEEITKLKGQVESHKTTINALREQNKIVEERLAESEKNTTSLTFEITTLKKKILTLEDEISHKIDKIHNLTQLLETSRSETEELSTELSKVIAEHQKANNNLKNERDQLRSQVLGLQQNLREVQDNLQLKTDELRVIQMEYEGYKVRAQSVLRQNQNRDVGMEEKLSGEVALYISQNATLTDKLNQNMEKLKSLETSHEKLLKENEIDNKKLTELEGEIHELKNQYAELSAKHERTIAVNAETVRSLKVHADTLSQCYRQQISEQEVRHNREIVELQSRLEKPPTPTEAHPALPTAAREEGEGSESVESALVVGSGHPVPLERLLGSESEQEIGRMEKRLAEQEAKVVHLTALLSDTEQDLLKHVQMNKLLKEEIRRQQRSEEREKHAENLEYLKNVVFKFVTLNSGDERTRLVPVLNTILKLSPDETKKLNLVAKGDGSLKGWTNYLPGWSSPSKPE
ncbi:unnamed protein product [Phaedon cochleariae]|uniref:GRIP domain-containing protein n=1 Tax=Phaedon cochleariae TaxID=80249 RepID=A0A9P0DP43_PHACE|nr:unnamed protein product [Phaedon cochleariae]